MDKVDIILGPISGVSGAAIIPYINSRGVPTVFPVYALDDLTQRKRSKWIVRTAWTSTQTSYPFAEYCYNVLGYRKVAFLASDYQFSYELVGGFQRVFEGLGGTCTQRIYVPYTVLDFNPYIPQLDRKVDAIYLMFGGKHAMQFLKQYEAAGLKGKIQLIGTGVVTDENSLPRMGDEALGVITTLHYSTALQNPENLEFQKKFKKLAGKISGYYGESYYTGAKWFHAAVEALKGDLRDKKKLMGGFAKCEDHLSPRTDEAGCVRLADSNEHLPNLLPATALSPRLVLLASLDKWHLGPVARSMAWYVPDQGSQRSASRSLQEKIRNG